MFSKILFASLLASAAYSAVLPEAVDDFVSGNSDSGKLWALLVAGSNGYYNYRHQADICHAYQIMKAHGIPDENIVVMMYDDIAENSQNPDKGVIINEPNGPNVYDGVLKDYTGADVTPENFLNILKGDASAMKGIGSGKVIASGPNDHVFVNFADHGAVGLVGFPSDVLHASDLNDALQSMASNNQFAKLVFYMEACESGSMFQDILPSNINIYAATASNADESSYACYFDSTLGTYLGDVFSVNWMQNSDANDIETETILKQINNVTTETTTSHVSVFGDTALDTLDVGQFQGETNAAPKMITAPKAVDDAVNARDVPLAIIKNKIQLASDADERASLVAEYRQLLNKRQSLRQTVMEILEQLGNASHIFNANLNLNNNRQCAKNTVDFFRHNCFNFADNPYAMEMVKAFVSACEMGHSEQSIVEAMINSCADNELNFVL